MTAPSADLIPLDAPTLVEASAGTGKTYAITTCFVRAIVEEGLTPDAILVVTYTKAATAELRMRARSRIREAISMLEAPPEAPDALHGVLTTAVESLGKREVERRLGTALGQMDQSAIQTIHGFCQRLLQDYPLEFGIDLEIEVAENVAAMHADLAVDFWATRLYDQPEWLLRELRARKVNIAHLEKLARVATMPGVAELLGPEPTETDAAAIEELSTLHARAAELWFEHRDEILELLQRPELNKTSYQPKSVRGKWAAELDELFKGSRLGELPGFFEKICTGRFKTKQRKEPPQHAFFDACEAVRAGHAAAKPALDRRVFELQRDFCDFVRERSRVRRDESATYTFDDLLTTVHAGVTDRASVAALVRDAYPLALVDEFQDTDSIQYGIFRAVYGDGRAVYVGDPKQAIYAFRGADVFSYLEAAKDVGDRVHTLTTNRRSDPGLVRAVNALFSRHVPPFLIDGIGLQPVEAHERNDRSTLAPPLEIVLLNADQLRGPAEVSVAPIVANEVALLLRSGAKIDERPIEPGDVAVLCRSNAKALAVTKALRALDVPTSLDGDASVLNTDVANELLAVLEAALMPGDSPTVRRALTTSLIGVSPFELASMEDEAWSDWVSQFRQWNEAWHEYGVLRCLQAVLTHSRAETTLASRPSARRDLTDLLHLQELLLRGERERARDPIALMQWFRRLKHGTPDEGMVAVEDLQQRPDADAGAVRVTTIHKSKGLEYGVVFCPFPWGDAALWQFDGKAVKFHDEDGVLRIDLGSVEHEAHRDQARLETASEAIRLLYVAVTRAKHQCTLFWGPGRNWRESALAHVIYGRDRPKGRDDAEMRADVEALVAEAPDVMRWRPPQAEQAARLPHPGADEQLAPRPRTRDFDLAPRITSFTNLTGHHEKAPGPPIADATSPLFADLPGGVRTGLLLHSILERVDLGSVDDDPAREVIRQQLSIHGFDASLEERVRRDLALVASTPLLHHPLVPSLGALDRAAQLRELEFTLSVERPSVEGLAALLKARAEPAAASGYAERLSEVSSRTLRGFLRGFIDLVFESGGRWYVADYKSNRLPSYEKADVTEAVQRDHYVLQGLLYSAAVHRYLRQRLASYDPKEHWGGMLFLFVRGMSGPDATAGSVFFDRPSPALLDDVDSWLGGSDEAR